MSIQLTDPPSLNGDEWFLDSKYLAAMANTSRRIISNQLLQQQPDLWFNFTFAYFKCSPLRVKLSGLFSTLWKTKSALRFEQSEAGCYYA